MRGRDCVSGLSRNIASLPFHLRRCRRVFELRELLWSGGTGLWSHPPRKENLHCPDCFCNKDFSFQSKLISLLFSFTRKTFFCMPKVFDQTMPLFSQKRGFLFYSIVSRHYPSLSSIHLSLGCDAKEALLSSSRSRSPRPPPLLQIGLLRREKRRRRGKRNSPALLLDNGESLAAGEGGMKEGRKDYHAVGMGFTKHCLLLFSNYWGGRGTLLQAFFFRNLVVD